MRRLNQDVAGSKSARKHRIFNLWASLSRYGVNTTNDHIFVKIDTEGAEALIVPSLIEWVKAAPRTPTIFLSMHSRADKTQRAKVAEFLNLFPFYGVMGGRDSRAKNPDYDKGSCKKGVDLQANAKGDHFNETMICKWCDYLLVADDSRAKEVCSKK